MKAQIQIVEDEVIVARDIKEILQKAGYHISGLAHDYDTGLIQFKNRIPDLLICDINLGNGKNGIELVKELNSIRPIPIIFLTAYSDDDTVSAALNTNPESYLTKPFTKEQLLISVNRILKSFFGDKPQLKDVPNPTRRELEIIYFIAKGDSSRSIAKKLCISFETVQTHRKNIFNKYNVSSSGELIAYAHKYNWLR